MKGIQFDNASQRKTYVGAVYEIGTDAIKKQILSEIDPEAADLHRSGKIHLHDLEAYGKTYNCLTLDLLKGFPFERFEQYSDSRKIMETFNYFRRMIVELANEQSGGMGFANFDEDISRIFKRCSLSPTDYNLITLRENIESFIDWINNARERCGQVSYYVSLNLGLSENDFGRAVSKFVLEYFGNSSPEYIRPNIIFKVKSGINHDPKDPNYDLFQLALSSTSRKMVPTYLLCDSAPNINVDASKIGIMGCRTRVVQNEFGEDTTIGRGNIDYITINLPRIALEIDSMNRDSDTEERIRLFKEAWLETANSVKLSLLDRYNRLSQLDVEDFPCNSAHNLWLGDVQNCRSLNEIFKNGTLSIGFIGLSEAIEILTGKRFYESQETCDVSLDFVRFMRQTVDRFRKENGLNFSLLATSGEYISGRFPDLDAKLFNHPVIEKGFYTNSFHANVDSGLSPFDKIRLEGPFHILCNGGCISYVEFSSAPLTNTLAILDIINVAVKNGVSYLGINFPVDSCLSCGQSGVFDQCPNCGGNKIKRIRRVSGYLEDLEFFTKGKKAEVATRRSNK
ncbi:MAG: anaerobic ribonucleoside triphosphate reductase [Methanomassiliicoccales archaeon PtaU1.Bin124]|nr:MAG: anaerobic ribonucleoside triphosphate reductase [Methanomassiliicoccales archaeon PtaU1.Bin124]